MKNCKYCNSEMECVHVDDNGGQGRIKSIAFNVYVCENHECMALLREDVWSDAGDTWIKPGNEE